MEGIFNLNTPVDLLKKLEHDFCLMQKRADDPYIAFNFFVTAEHMLDWLFPGYEHKKERDGLRNSEMILQICSHIASGAKHFYAQAKHHKSVSDTSRRAVYKGGCLPKNSFPVGSVPKYGLPGRWSDELCIQLSGDASVSFGEVISVLSLAEEILNFWRKKLKEIT